MKQPAAPISAKAARPVRPARKRPAGKVAVAVAVPVAAAPPADSFPIVGIGASAGGLEALEQFLHGVPPASGLVFAIVQHLDPTHKGMLAELLRHCTPLPVRQITDRMPVERDHVYVIQPNRDLSILHGVLHLLEPAAPRGLRLPIDFFLRSLAADRQQRSVGVILSGKGSDGTLGLRAIKERAGAVFVQSPASARFDGMPRSAIDAGLADRVAAADGLAGQIVACLQHVPLFIARPDADLRFADPQKKLLPLFRYSVSLGGVLVLGSAGATGQAGDLFDAVPGKNRICWRKPSVLPPDLVTFPSAFVQQHAGGPAFHSPARRPAAPPPAAEPNLQALTDVLVLRRFAPAAVLATARGDLVYSSAKAGKYLEPATGGANLNLFAIAREGLAGPLVGAFAHAGRQQVAVESKGLRVGSIGGSHAVDVIVQPLTAPAALRGMVLVVWTDVAAAVANPDAASAKAPGTAPGKAWQAEETARAREELLAARAEMQAWQEELKSTNEELQRINEELQSTNEELTTSKEGMQSMNEELHTVNRELRSKVDELTLASDDISKLLNSTDIATLFLDNDLQVRRFTTQAASLSTLIPGDAGRPITDLGSGFDAPLLTDHARDVLRTRVPIEVKLPTHDGRWSRVRTMPHRTQDHRIDGVVTTFSDISVSKALEATLREALAVLQGRFADQGASLDAAHTLKGVLQAALAVPEERLGAQTAELRQARADVLAKRHLSAGRRPAP